MSSEPSTVVCIEDEPGVIELIRLILERRGLKVVGAVSGMEGLEVVRQVKPSLVLLDLMMPGMDGWEVYRRMKADAMMKTIPVIIVTAKAEGIDEVLAKHIAKVDDYIKKPFSLQELLQSIERVLNRKKTPPSL
jgi:two-component system alkaline phosphatase synthesis response regulator PhoP